MATKNYLDVEDLEVYKRLCQLHIDVCDLTHAWLREEKYELGSQVRRSSNSAPAQLAEKNEICFKTSNLGNQGPNLSVFPDT